MLTPPNIHTDSLIAIRHHLHRFPELSGQEQQTAAYITEQLKHLSPDYLYKGIGGTGVAAVFDSKKTGKTLLFRCELDALPIQEKTTVSYRSCRDGVAHLCGHDGHMTTILALAKKIAANRPTVGRAVVLFQPAEETGEGAPAVVADQQFERIAPDESYALHNLPGYPLGEVLIREGTFNCASRGMAIRLTGRTAHAAYPETGISPQFAVADLLQKLPDIPSQLNSQTLCMLTIVHCHMGEQAFGTAPADACVMATLRTETDEDMAQLVSACQDLAKQLANQYQLELQIDYADVFAASVNHADCVSHVIQAAENTGHSIHHMTEPMRWSEDFGAISATAKGAMFAFGADVQQPQLHNPDYHFPDELIDKGCDIFFDIYRRQLLST